MLSRDVQSRLARRYGGQHAVLVKKAFDQRAMGALESEFVLEREEYSVVVMVDIAGFSRRVSGFGAAQVRRYLDDFYGVVMPAFFERGGMIDRVAGDGVLGVFSSFFGADPASVDRDAMRAAEVVVERLSGTECPVKAAVGSGALCYCKTGVAGVYEECTVVGRPITVAYRIEEIARENQVVLESNARVVEIIDRQLQRSSALAPARWQVRARQVNLRGLGDVQVIVQDYS